MQMGRMQRTCWLIKVSVLALGATAEINTAIAGANASSLYEEIKAFRIRQLSDVELRKAWDEAEVIRVSEAEQIEARKLDDVKRREELRAKCSDVVFKTRNEARCQNAYSTMWMMYDEKPRSREQIYESIIVGICNFLGEDRRALVKAKCLPQ